MTKSIAIIAAAIMAVSTPALAGGHNQNPGEARAMAGDLKGGDGGKNSPLVAIVEGLTDGETCEGAVASCVSGGGIGGWGNVGSTLTGVPNVSVSGR